MEHFLDFCLPIFVGVLSSYILLLLLFTFMKPSFRISDKMSYIDSSRFVAEFKNSYLIKVTNVSWYMAYNINVKLEKIESYGVKNGKNNRLLPLSMLSNQVTYIKNCSFMNPSNGENAYLFRTKEDINAILENNDKIRFTLTAKHGFSGLTKIFIKDYEVLSDIETGHFKFGKSFDIIK
ncbi:MAG: hypothetical protein H7250_07450 [Flavobacterium sp.]|nr:hypothetical protein [Flavobacterium sp.]